MTPKSFYSKRFVRQKSKGHFSEREDLRVQRNSVVLLEGKHLNSSSLEIALGGRSGLTWRNYNNDKQSVGRLRLSP